MATYDQQIRVTADISPAEKAVGKLTTGLGKIEKLGDSHIGMDVGNGVVLQLQRSAVIQVLPKGTIK